ncbi:hypothetical protein CEUSTIGMA_g1733.t1 [Chlamydomonas eustigma]|uniref:Uncharacterized protein n=1 Tax=Chlamydomonas eustigma TaxID=1157962 RepID=A0A250WTZ6_9CHLO|nr:hypothetical protein CEUSTIGMA_g1733.t1 [Chlamydomonas eustigma]|eukprot:GAX74284.1 hypothetical protein CEUSTIGMA_g1733.t1 [Chlamydomonas eustigma]
MAMKLGGLTNPKVSTIRTGLVPRVSIFRSRPTHHQHSKHIQIRFQHDNSLKAASVPENATTSATTYDIELIDTFKEALDLGLTLCREKRWAEALGIFEKSLTLPGTGIKRFRDKPRAISDGEKMTALYNMACCHSQLNDARTGLVALSGCLEAGYEDFKQIRIDPDLQNLRADERFEALMKRFEPKKSQGLFGLFGMKE